MVDLAHGPLTKKDQLGIVNAVTMAITQSIELDVVLKTALEKVMEAFGVGNGGIYLVDLNTGRLRLVVSKGLTRAFEAEKSDIPPGTGCAGLAADKGRLLAASETPRASYVCEDAERLMGMDCLLASPLSSKAGVQGVIELFAPASRRLTREEASLIKVISDQVGIAIENARLYEESRDNVVKLTELQGELATTNRKLRAHLTQELHIAEMLQKSLLPRRLPRIPGIRIATRLISATEAADVGGDFYDFIEDEKTGQVMIVVGDVCGSGIEAATLTGVTKNTIRAFGFEDYGIPSILTRTNRVLYVQAEPSKFVAIFLALLDPRTKILKYCVAGQPVPLVHRRGEVFELKSGFVPLAVEPQAVYSFEELQLEAGDTLVTFTDGLIEARRGPETFGSESVKDLIEAYGERSLDDLIDMLLTEAREFGGGKLRDDVAVVAMRLKE